MRILPQTKSEKIRFASFLALLVLVLVFFRIDRPIAYALSDKQEGDILFQALPHSELGDAIEGITDSEWSHCGILLKKDGHWVVAEAIRSVRYTPLYLWIVRSRQLKIESYRVPNLTSADREKLRAGVAKLFGKPYDFRYAPDDREIYCSELVYKVYDRELGIQTGTWQKLRDLNWQPHETFIRSLEGDDPPLDREMITPVALTRSPNSQRVFP